MPILTAQQKKQRSLMGVVLGVVVITVGVLYFGFLKNPDKSAKFVDKEGYLDIFIGAREIKLNTELLEDDRFKSLIPYSRIPTDIKTGRDSPFSSYNLPAQSRPTIVEDNATSTASLQP